MEIRHREIEEAQVIYVAGPFSETDSELERFDDTIRAVIALSAKPIVLSLAGTQTFGPIHFGLLVGAMTAAKPRPQLLVLADGEHWHNVLETCGSPWPIFASEAEALASLS